MGRGKIIENVNGKGLYLIDYYYDTSRIEARISKMEADIVAIETVDLPRLQNTLTSAYTNWQDAIAGENAEIINPEATEESISAKTRVKLAASLAIEKVAAEIADKKGELVPIRREIDFLNEKKVEKKSVSAWCADALFDIPNGTEVGVMEFPGEGPGIQKPVIIQPGGKEEVNHQYNAERDGMMTQGYALSPEMTFFLLSMFTGWQRWQPLYRLATISLVDKEADTCTVHFANTESSYQGLSTIPEGKLTVPAVPIEYIDCNADIFENGDSVVVKCTQTGNFTYDFKVIGFEQEPNECSPTFTGTGKLCIVPEEEPVITCIGTCSWINEGDERQYTMENAVGSVEWRLDEGDEGAYVTGGGILKISEGGGSHILTLYAKDNCQESSFEVMVSERGHWVSSIDCGTGCVSDEYPNGGACVTGRNTPVYTWHYWRTRIKTTDPPCEFPIGDDTYKCPGDCPAGGGEEYTGWEEDTWIPCRAEEANNPENFICYDGETWIPVQATCTDWICAETYEWLPL